MSTKACPFCDKTQKYRHVFSGKFVRVVFPKSPACHYHLLVVPKRHILYYDYLKPDESQELFEFIQQTVVQARRNIKNFIGYNILSNNGGEKVNQRVKHCHIHIFLRQAGENDPIKAPHKQPQKLNEDQQNTLKEIKMWLDYSDKK